MSKIKKINAIKKNCSEIGGREGILALNPHSNGLCEANGSQVFHLIAAWAQRTKHPRIPALQNITKNKTIKLRFGAF